MALGAAMLMVGKVQFGYIYGIGAVGVIGMWFLGRFHNLSVAYYPFIFYTNLWSLKYN